jgi:glycosyltransferase involved in cell wall biosynthesis
MLNGGAGISRYIQELTLKLLALDKANQYVLFFNRLTPDLDQLYRPFGHDMVATGIGHYSLAEQIQLPFILRKYKLDLVHFPHFNVPLLYSKPFVVTIHDLTHTKFPGRKKSHIPHRIAYNLVLINAIKTAKKIIAVSQATKKEILEHFAGIPTDKIQVVYEGSSEFYSMTNKDDAMALLSKKFGLSKPFLLYVGVWRRYKNLPALAQAFDRLAEQFDYDLVLAGEPDPFYPEIQAQVMGIKHRDRIRALGRVSEVDLKNLYNAAALTVMPSLHEGFGLPLLESAARGTGVACSDIPTLREVMGQAAEYFDPTNLDNIVDVLAGLLSNPLRMEELANLALNRVKHFSWKQTAAETLNIYQSIQ